jgi:hypothetical protein
MASLVLSGDTSGSITVSAPAVAGSTTQTLVNVTGTLAPIVQGTALTAVTNFTTSADFTSIPSWVERITLIFSGLSLSGTDNMLIQIGDSGGLETTGYLGAGGYALTGAATVAGNFTTGWGIAMGSSAGVFHGTMQIVNLTGNTWISSSSGGFSNAAAFSGGGGNKTLSAQLDRVSVTRTGTNTFTAGTINILYE